MRMLIHLSNQLIAEVIYQLSSIIAIVCKHEDAHLTPVLLSQRPQNFSRAALEQVKSRVWYGFSFFMVVIMTSGRCGPVKNS